MAIGKRIAQRLEALGWSRSQLMDAVDGLTPQALSNLITRDSKRSEWDEAIAQALGVSVMWLVYGRDDAYSHGSATVIEAQEASPALRRLIAAASRLTRDDQLVLVGRAEEMAAQAVAARKTA